MFSKFLIVSILDLLLGLNFLSPVVLVHSSLGNRSDYIDSNAQNEP